MSCLLDMIVCTHQSLYRCVQVRKACVLCDNLTSGKKSTQRRKKWRRKAWRVGDEEQPMTVFYLGVEMPPHRSLVYKSATRYDFLQSHSETLNTNKSGFDALRGILTNVELSDLSVETMHTE